MICQQYGKTAIHACFPTTSLSTIHNTVLPLYLYLSHTPITSPLQPLGSSDEEEPWGGGEEDETDQGGKKKERIGGQNKSATVNSWRAAIAQRYGQQDDAEYLRRETVGYKMKINMKQ